MYIKYFLSSVHFPLWYLYLLYYKSYSMKNILACLWIPCVTQIKTKRKTMICCDRATLPQSLMWLEIASQPCLFLSPAVSQFIKLRGKLEASFLCMPLGSSYQACSTCLQSGHIPASTMSTHPKLAFLNSCSHRILSIVLIKFQF